MFSRESKPTPSSWHWNSWVGGRSKIYSTKLPIYKKRHLPTVNTATNEHLFGHVGDVHGGNDERPFLAKKPKALCDLSGPTRLTFSLWFCIKMTWVDKIWLVEQDFYSFWPPKNWMTCTCKKKCRWILQGTCLNFKKLTHGILDVIWHVLEKPLHLISSHKSA